MTSPFSYALRCLRCRNGQLGNGYANATLVATPPTFDVITGVAQVAAGDVHTCVVMQSNFGVRCFGGNMYGQLGNSSASFSDIVTVPVTDGLVGAALLSSKFSHSCVVMSASTGVRCWGLNA